MGRILILFDNVSADYVSRITDGATDALRAAGTKFTAHNLFNSDSQIADILEDTSISGVILTPPLSDDRTVLSQLEAKRLPFVRLAAMLDLERGSSVNMDELLAATAITKVLLENGHRKIAFLKGPRSHLVSIRRFNGFAGALGGAGLVVDHDLIVQGDFSRESGREHAPALFRMKPSAIFASNDEMALGVIDAAKAQGIAIPGDISLVGFDDNRDASRSNPPLTTVRQPLNRMGARAAELIMELSKNSATRNVVEEVPFEVIERKTVSRLEEVS